MIRLLEFGVIPAGAREVRREFPDRLDARPCIFSCNLRDHPAAFFERIVGVFKIPVGLVAEKSQEKHGKGAAEVDGEEDQGAGVGEGVAEAAEKSKLANLAADLVEQVTKTGVSSYLRNSARGRW